MYTYFNKILKGDENINRKCLILVFLLISVISISSVSAEDSNNLSDTNNNINNINNNFDIDINSSNTSTQNINYENPNNPISPNDKNVSTGEEDHSFTDLQSLLNSSKSNTINLTNDYTCNSTTDSEIINASGIKFSPSETTSYTINGNGHILDGNCLTRIFNCNNFNGNLTLNNVIFKGGKSTQYGGAIYWYTNYALNLINCTFINSKSNGGGAIYIYIYIYKKYKRYHNQLNIYQQHCR